MLVGTGVCRAWGGPSDRGRRLGTVTASSSPTSLQVHCGQLSDSEEWSLQAVEKHVSGRRAGVRWGGEGCLLKTLITVGKMILPGCWTDLGSSPPPSGSVTFRLCNLSKSLNFSEHQLHI